MKKNVVADLVLLLVALIWGTTFVVVQNAIATLAPHSFNGIRFTMASVVLLPVVFYFDKNAFRNIDKNGWLSGILLGVFLFGGYAFQTVGLLYTTASKAGFITGLSVVIVPILSIFLLKIVPKWPTVLGVISAAIGLYLLTMVKATGFQLGDTLVFLCAIFFALHIVFTGKFAPNYPTLTLAWIQISVVALLSLLFAFLFEDFQQNVHLQILMQENVVTALLITSIFATAFAYIAQTNFQIFTTATRVAIIYSMEPVFAAITSYIVLKERLSNTTIIGGLLIFVGMIFAEIPAEKFSNLRRKTTHKLSEQNR